MGWFIGCSCADDETASFGVPDFFTNTSLNSPFVYCSLSGAETNDRLRWGWGLNINTMSILIKNGRILTASEDYHADIYIEGETIHSIGKNLNVSADQVIDATGKVVFPGGIDPHVHLDMPFMGTYSSDNYETGTLAALARRHHNGH